MFAPGGGRVGSTPGDRTRCRDRLPAGARRGAVPARRDVAAGHRLRRTSSVGSSTRSGSSTSSATASRRASPTDAHDVARRFFALPEAQRLAIENVRSPQFRGYTRFGHEHTNGRVDLRDQIDIGRELAGPRARARRTGLAAPARPQPLAGRRARAPHGRHRPGWTTSRSSARPCCGRWPVALDLPADTFDDAVSPPEVLLKVIRYLTPDARPPRRASTSARASGPTATRASCRSSTRTTSAGCRSSATDG